MRTIQSSDHKKSRVSRSLKRRSSRGDLAIELSCGAFLFLVFSMLSFDLGLLVFCADFNDRACRDAARAAAQGSDLASATKLANVALKAHSPAIAFMSIPTIQGPLNYVDFGGNPPNKQTSPYVQVTTATYSKIPTGPVEFLGAKFLPGGQASFVQTYTFPIIKTK
jgi:Flp pilus assembly protein TadG